MKGFQDSKGNCLCVYTATAQHKTGEPGCYWEEPPWKTVEEFGEGLDYGPCLTTDANNAAEVQKAFPSIRVRASRPQRTITFPTPPDASPTLTVKEATYGPVRIPSQDEVDTINQNIRNRMKVSITPKQTRKRPQRTTVHGEPGIGKTTFAADAPDVVFLCTEAGADNVNVSHLHYEGHDPRTYEEVLAALEGVPTDGSVKNVCIDTVDGLEGIIHAHIKTTTGKPVGEHGYGKGYDKALDLMRGVLASLERLRDKGVGTILLAHSTIESFANPEGADFSYVTIKAHKKIAGLLVEWSDAVLYARREQRAYTNDAGKTIGVGSSKRELCTEKTPTFVAKNRLRLPPTMPLSWADYQRAIDTFVPLDAKALRKEASELAAAFGAPAMAELEKIGDDAGDLLAFVEYCKGLKK